MRRNTPTGVGKTRMLRNESHPLRKHPHGRGEDHLPQDRPRRSSETPPRAWGRRCARLFKTAQLRNTPTGVGKTVFADQKNPNEKKHPHGRGEDCAIAQKWRAG